MPTLRDSMPPVPSGSDRPSGARIDLDHNATTRAHPDVIETVARHMRETYGNPGSRHAEGRRARRVLEDARESIARILDAQPQEVIFTSGGTESANLALFGLARRPGTVLLTPGEHPSTAEACERLRERGWTLRHLELDGDGRIATKQYDSLPWDEVRLATVILAHNETGVIQDLVPLADRCRECGIPLHVDAVQAAGRIRFSFHSSGATAMSIAAHKFHGPRGVGALLLRKGVSLTPLAYGGHQESGRRPGTEPVALVAGMARALEICHADLEARVQHMRELRDRLERGLEATCAPIVIHSRSARRLPNTSNVAFPGVDGEALLVALDLQGIACSLGSTCASGSTEPAPVLVAMGCSPEVYRSSVRFSLGVDNTAEEIDEAVRRIAGVVTSLRQTVGSTA